MRKLLILALLTACGREPQPLEEVTPTEDKAALLDRKVLNYESWIQAHQDANGFILTDKCDSLLFSSLLSAAGLDVAVDAAKDSSGAWHRRPAQDCGPANGNSRSTISRDMIIGLMWHFWMRQDVAGATQLMNDLRANKYMLKGDGSIGELLMTPAMLNTLAQLIKGLGGHDYSFERNLPFILSSDTGYVAHLTVWHIMLRSAILGKVSATEQAIVGRHANRNPQNPLFAAAYANLLHQAPTQAIDLLLNTEQWPDYRLPSTGEHCDPWPVQRDADDSGWAICGPELVEHPGAELIVIYRLLMETVRAQRT